MDSKKTVVQITQNGMGNGPEELSQLLAKNYFTLLIEEKRLPRAILFYNNGVKLLCNGSPALKPLKNLEEQGVLLIACKTCLNFFNLLDGTGVGTTGTMADILDFQVMAERVITL